MIRQFDVFATPFKRDRLERPYYVVVQADWLATQTRVCVPLVAARFLKPQRRLNPAFNVRGEACYVHPVEPIVLPVRVLTSAVDNLMHGRDRIIAALDLVFTGI